MPTYQKKSVSVSEDIKASADHVSEEAGVKAPDTIHGDEAMKVLANYTGDQDWHEDEEKKLRRRIDKKLLPVLCMTYALLYYDKVMLGHAVRQVSG